jgi:hypothetical protein
LDLYKEKLLCNRNGQYEESILVDNEQFDLKKKKSPKSFHTCEQTKSKWGNMHQQYYQEKDVLGIRTQALK